MICLGISFFLLCLDLWVSSLHHIWKNFSHYFLQIRFFNAPSFGDLITHIFSCIKLSHSPLRLCSFFFPVFFSLCFILKYFCCYVFKSLIFFSVMTNLLLILPSVFFILYIAVFISRCLIWAFFYIFLVST